MGSSKGLHCQRVDLHGRLPVLVLLASAGIAWRWHEPLWVDLLACGAFIGFAALLFYGAARLVVPIEVWHASVAALRARQRAAAVVDRLVLAFLTAVCALAVANRLPVPRMSERPLGLLVVCMLGAVWAVCHTGADLFGFGWRSSWRPAAARA